MSNEGTLVKRLRQELGINQRALAAKAGLHSGQMSLIESGQHGLTEVTARKLGKALGVDPLALAVAAGFDAMRVAAEKGQIADAQITRKAASLLSAASEAGALTSGEVQQFIEIGRELRGMAQKAAGRAATKARGGSIYEDLDCDSPGQKREKPYDGSLAALREPYHPEERDYGGAQIRRGPRVGEDGLESLRSGPGGTKPRKRYG